MTMIKSFEKWAQKLKPFHIGYKNDFFVLHYLANSPQEMIQRFLKMPFAKIDQKHQRISINTPFARLVCHYRNLQDDFYIIQSESEYKANLLIKNYDDPETPSDYFCLTLRTDHPSNHLNSLANGVSYPNCSWILFKPQHKVDHYYFIGSKGYNTSLFF
jgi:hypothetical protein